MSTQYWEEEIETMSREKLQELQLQRLKKTINIAANSPYYKEVFSKNGIPRKPFPGHAASVFEQAVSPPPEGGADSRSTFD